MKRLTLASLVLVMLLAFMPSAQADTLYQTQCQTKIGPNGNKAMQVCVSLRRTFLAGSYHWSSEVAANNVAGYNPAASLHVDILHFWSKDSGTGWCDGQYPGCIGSGNGFEFDISPGGTGATLQLDSTSHLCMAHANFYGRVHFSAGNDSAQMNFDSAPDYTVSPCT